MTTERNNNGATTEVAQLLKPINASSVGAVFENRVDNAGIAAIIVQRQKAELKALQERALSRLEQVLKPALNAATTAVLAAFTKALNLLLPKALDSTRRMLGGFSLPPYSRTSVNMHVGGVSILHDDEKGYACCGFLSGYDRASLDVYADVEIFWSGAAFASATLHEFPDEASGTLPTFGVRVSSAELHGYKVRLALARFGLPQYVIDAIKAEDSAKVEHDTVADYIMKTRRALQDTGELHEQALASLSEMSLRQTEGGEALLASITDRVRVTFAPKVPQALLASTEKA